MYFTVRFLPEDRSYTAHEPMDCILAAASCDVWLEHPCGKKAICGKCKVRIEQGEAPISAADRNLLTSAEIADGWRLSCQLVLSGNAVVRIPAVSRSVAAKPFGPPDLFATGFRPVISKQHIQVPEATDEIQQADLDRIREVLRIENLQTALDPLRVIAHVIASGGHGVTATLREDAGSLTLIDLQPGDTTEALFGVAFDIGSTTIAAALVRLRDGEVIASQTRLNPQVKYGADIISRIHYAQENPAGNHQLHEALISACETMIEQLVAHSGVEIGAIYEITCAGNPTMLHTLLGADVVPLGQAPYVGAWTCEMTVRAKDLGLPIATHTNLRTLPMIRSHVGGDTVAAVLAAGIDESDGWSVMIDLGTNSEVVLGRRGQMVATSTAAGPAFEGANIYMGMRASTGAIDAVRVSPDGRVVCKTIGNEEPRGICGSGLIDACAELVQAGIIAPSGYMHSREELSGVPEALIQRMTSIGDGQRAFRLGGDVVLTAQDVRQLQLIKGSIRAGMEILLHYYKLTEKDLTAVKIAGAFGNFIRKTSVIAIGLVPDIDPEKVQFIGNAAGVGARMVLVNAAARERARHIAATCEYVELAGHPAYQDAFCAAIPFPQEQVKSASQ